MSRSTEQESLPLDSETLARLSSLQLRVKHVVDGTMAGLHRSPHHGSSVEFAEHKPYSPGDDLRRLDWKAYAKFDRYFLRRFEEETELKAYLLLDCSGSMGYGEPLSKLAYGSVLVASLALLLARQRDQPGLLAFDERVRTYVPPRSRATHTRALLAELERLRPEGRTDVVAAVTYLMEVIGRRSMVVFVSDLFDSEDALGVLRELRIRRHEVVLFQLLHPDEIELPFDRVTIFEAMEEERELLVDPAGLRQIYRREMDRFCERVEHACKEAEVDHHLVTTADPLDQVLLRLLARRGRR